MPREFYDPSNPPPARTPSELTEPSFVLRSLGGLLGLPDNMALSSVSRSDSAVVIKTQVLFLTGAIISSIKDTPVLKSYPSPCTDLVGLIGCGLIGTAIVDSLLEAGMPPRSLLIVR